MIHSQKGRATDPLAKPFGSFQLRADGTGFYYGYAGSIRLDVLPPLGHRYARPWEMVCGDNTDSLGAEYRHATQWTVFIDGEQVGRVDTPEDVGELLKVRTTEMRADADAADKLDAERRS